MTNNMADPGFTRCVDSKGREMPPNFPPNISHPLAWNAKELQMEDYVVELSPEELIEVDSALRAFKALGIDGKHVGRNNFPLPSLGPKLDTLAVQVHAGIGFFVLRGISATMYTSGDSLVIYLGIAAYIGNRRGRQDADGNMLTHVENFTNHFVPPEKRHGIHSDKNIMFHTDITADIISQHMRQTASVGGELLLAPVWTMYNEIAASRPDIIRTLSEPVWPYQQVGAPAGYLSPILFAERNNIICSFDPSPLYKAASLRNCPPLTTHQLDAMCVVQDMAYRHALEIKMQAGDFIFCNNLAILHSRRHFQDSRSQKRHVIRLWLRNSDLGWKIPKQLQESWNRVFSVPEGKQVYLVEPKPYNKIPRIAFGTASVSLVGDEEI